MGRDHQAQVACPCDQVDDQEDSKERRLQRRAVCDPRENKFTHPVLGSMIVFLHEVHLGYLGIKSTLCICNAII